MWSPTRSLALALTLSGLSLASTAAAQVYVVEEEQVRETQVVERGYVRGQGRGIQYGAHLISPVYLTTVAPPGGADPIAVSGGLGLHGRVGWEFPSGFTIEVFGGFAANGVDRPSAFADSMSSAFTRVEVGAGLRYMFINDTAFVPFVQVGASFRWFWFDYVDVTNRLQEIDAELTAALHGAVGFQIELSPYFGIELGCAVEYTAWADIFSEPGLVSLMPFAGVTLYVYDETGN